MKTYVINEMFYSLQGEGARAGSANVFVRFAGCNLTCSKEREGFDCDTDFSSGIRYTLEEVCARINELVGNPEVSERKNGKTYFVDPGVIFTGGEPTLQLDAELVSAVKAMAMYAALETNGLRPVEHLGLDWVSCSPKTAEHTLKVEKVSELRYVRAHMQALPKPTVQAEHYYLSPAFTDAPGEWAKNLAWCIDLCKKNPTWRLSVQNHKFWGAR